MTDQNRSYRMQRRAETQEQTRLRITRSAVALHGTLGPARTSVSAVADHAGVRRSTVYRHFRDEASLFDACTAHWTAANPAPDLSTFTAIKDPGQRLHVALGELYGFYRRNEAMLDNLFRDETTVSLVQERFAAFHGYLEAMRSTLMHGRKNRGTAPPPHTRSNRTRNRVQHLEITRPSPTPQRHGRHYAHLHADRRHISATAWPFRRVLRRAARIAKMSCLGELRGGA